jgi:probable rRNA maturation factor
MLAQPRCQLEIAYQVAVADDRLRYQQAAEWVAGEYGLASMQVSIAIVNDSRIHELNSEFLEHDWPTDVISFIFEVDEESRTVEGEIIASADTAARLARDAGWRSEDELLLYVVHGLLHLAGLDDTDPNDQAEMRTAERACLLALGVVGAQQHLDRWNDVSY